MAARIARGHGMLPAMIEEAPEAFMQRWRKYAADAVLFARPEGSPLLEASLGSTIVQMLERTNPYLAVPGRARLLVNASASRIDGADDGPEELSVPSRGRLAGRGRVLEREGRLVVVDAGWPVLIEIPGDTEVPLDEGAWIVFEAAAPLHGFVLPPERRRGADSGRDVDEAH